MVQVTLASAKGAGDLFLGVGAELGLRLHCVASLRSSQEVMRQVVIRS